MRNLVSNYLVTLALLVTACGPSSRDKALRGTLLSVNAASEGFLTWSHAHANGIIDACEVRPTDLAASEAECHAKLAAFRKASEPAVAAIRVAYRAMAVAAIDGRTPLPVVLATVATLVDEILKLKQALAPLEKETP